MPASPSAATTPMVVFTIPLDGVLKPESGMSTDDVPLTTLRPSKTDRLRRGSPGSAYATTSDQPANELPPVPVCTLAMVYVPAPAADTSSVTSAKAV